MASCGYSGRVTLKEGFHRQPRSRTFDGQDGEDSGELLALIASLVHTCCSFYGR